MKAPGRRVVLVVDDEFAISSVLRLVLIDEGFAVHVADNGERALAVLSSEPIELVVADYEMPRMSGAELCRRMSEHDAWRGLPVILLSTTFRGDPAEVPQVVALFKKPFRIDELLGAVRRALPPRSPPQP